MPGLVEIVSGRCELVDQQNGDVVVSGPVWLVLFYNGEGVEYDRYAIESLDEAHRWAKRIAKERGAAYIR